MRARKKRIAKMHKTLLHILPLLLASFAACTFASPALCQQQQQPSPPLATETFNLSAEAEVGLEVKARSVGASWAREGAEAAALLITVDSAYNQDLLLWAGDEAYSYQVMLGRLPKGKHKVTVTINPARSAKEAREVEIASLKPLPFVQSSAQSSLRVEKGRSNTDNSSSEDAVALAHSPVLYARANTIDRFTDVPLLMYYEIEPASGGDRVVRYTVIFSHEDGGTPALALMARWGRTTDIEWVYELRLRPNGTIAEEIYQGADHKTTSFAGTRTAGRHPLLGVATINNNFSDQARSPLRFAPLPVRARLSGAVNGAGGTTRESLMDQQPRLYRVMAEELTRERRINNATVDVNTIADPRHYLYIEAYAEQAGGTALGFDVRLKDGETLYRSDVNGDARLLINRSGFFRVAVRLPEEAAAAASSSVIATISARCYAETAPQAAAATKPAVIGQKPPACEQVRLSKALVLDRNYMPRQVQLKNQPGVTLRPGESAILNAVGQ